MTQTTTCKETMNVIDVVNYFTVNHFMNNRKHMSGTILFFMAASDNRNVCDTDGNMSTEFIRETLTVCGDDMLFRELECEVTTRVPF